MENCSEATRFASSASLHSSSSRISGAMGCCLRRRSKYLSRSASASAEAAAASSDPAGTSSGCEVGAFVAFALGGGDLALEGGND